MGRSPELETTTQKASLTWFLLKTEASKGGSVGWPHLGSQTHTQTQSWPHDHPPLTFSQAQVTPGLSDLIWDSLGIALHPGAPLLLSHPVSLLFLIPVKSGPFRKLDPLALQINHSSGVWCGRFSRAACAE